MSTVTHRCQWCDSDYACETFEQGETEDGHAVSRCDCQVKDECVKCSPDLYKPLCVQCDEMGEYALGVEQVEGPLGRQWACTKHVNEAGEAGATMWSTEDVGAGERMASADRLNREGRY